MFLVFTWKVVQQIYVLAISFAMDYRGLCEVDSLLIVLNVHVLCWWELDMSFSDLRSNVK